MRNFLVVVCLVGAALGFGAQLPHAEANIDMGVSIGDEGLRGFYLSVGDYYRVPQREVLVVRERRIPDEELPVVFFLAQRARVAPVKIVELRLRGMSWIDITFHYGLNPEIYYVPVKEVSGPPYGKAYGHYKKKPKKEWKKIVLQDGDVVNLVNLRFMSEYHGYAPEEVIRLRSKGRTFVAIDDEVRKGKKDKHEKFEKVKGGNDKGNGNGKGKGKDKHKWKD